MQYDVYMGFNALYLKDAIDFLGTNMFYYPNLNNNASLKSCIYSFAGHKEKEAILLPVNIRDTSVVEANQVYEVQVLSVKKAI